MQVFEEKYYKLYKRHANNFF